MLMESKALVGQQKLRNLANQYKIILHHCVDNDLLVRAQLLGPDPPRLNIVPVGIITGELQLSREEYERQIAIAPSYYILYGYGARFFVGLRNVSEDKSTAQYYWMATWDDYLSSDPAKFWTSKASKQDLLDFALELTKNFHLRFMEIFSLTRPEDIMTPVIIVRDLEPRAMPSGRVTLLGDAVHPMTFCKLISGHLVIDVF